jgi:hypothetical protein
MAFSGIECEKFLLDVYINYTDIDERVRPVLDQTENCDMFPLYEQSSALTTGLIFFLTFAKTFPKVVISH